MNPVAIIVEKLTHVGIGWLEDSLRSGDHRSPTDSARPSPDGPVTCPACQVEGALDRALRTAQSAAQAPDRLRHLRPLLLADVLAAETAAIAAERTRPDIQAQIRPVREAAAAARTGLISTPPTEIAVTVQTLERAVAANGAAFAQFHAGDAASLSALRSWYEQARREGWTTEAALRHLKDILR